MSYFAKPRPIEKISPIKGKNVKNAYIKPNLLKFALIFSNLLIEFLKYLFKILYFP